MAMPFAQQYASEHEDEEKIAVVPPALAPILKRSGLPYEIWSSSKKQRKELSKKLKQEKVDKVTFLTNSLGSFWPYALARVKQRIGFQFRWTSLLLTDKVNHDSSLPQGERNLLLLKKPASPDVQAPYLIKNKKDDSGKRNLLIFTGAQYGPSKQWTANSYAEVISKALNEGWNIHLMGTQQDRDFAQSLIDAAPSNAIYNHCGQGDLNQLLDQLETLPSSLGLCNDSGAMHLLSACNIPVLGMYFSTSSLNTPPAYGPYKVLEANISCRPCYKRECPFEHYACRDKISPDLVWQQLRDL